MVNMFQTTWGLRREPGSKGNGRKVMAEIQAVKNIQNREDTHILVCIEGLALPAGFKSLPPYTQASNRLVKDKQAHMIEHLASGSLK